MSNGDELPLINDWIESRLKTDLEMSGFIKERVHEGIAPDDEQYPYVTYQQQSAVLVRGVGGLVIMADALYLVKAIAMVDNWTILRPINIRIDALMSGFTGVVLGGSIEGTVRRSPYSLIEEVEGRQIRHLGGIYEIQAQAI